MSPRGSRPNQFQAAEIAYEELVLGDPVDNTAYFTAVNQLERVGLKEVGERHVSPLLFATTMHAAYAEAVTIELVPPISAEQRQDVAKKFGYYAQMIETTTPRPRRRSRKVTDLANALTDALKP